MSYLKTLRNKITHLNIFYFFITIIIIYYLSYLFPYISVFKEINLTYLSDTFAIYLIVYLLKIRELIETTIL